MKSPGPSRHKTKHSKVSAGQNSQFPEFAEPHLTLASPAGIETSKPNTTHIASDEHNALTSGGHTSISAGKSFLVSVRNAIRFFAFDSFIKFVAAREDIDLVALKKNINLLAKLDITHTANRITITAKEEVLINGGTSYSRWNSAGIEHGTRGQWVEHAANHAMPGPKTCLCPKSISRPLSAFLACLKH